MNQHSGYPLSKTLAHEPLREIFTARIRSVDFCPLLKLHSRNGRSVTTSLCYRVVNLLAKQSCSLRSQIKWSRAGRTVKLSFVFRVQSKRRNNYTTMQRGPECATMTKELCLEAENTYTLEMEGFFLFFFFLFFWLMSISTRSIRTNKKKQQDALRES